MHLRNKFAAEGFLSLKLLKQDEDIGNEFYYI